MQLTEKNLELLADEAALELARREFWEYCKLIAEDFYIDDREHLHLLCDTLQKLYEGNLLKSDGTPYKKLMINMPPQHGKSRTLVNFCDWILGKNKSEKIIEASYNDDAAGDFSKYTRDGIDEKKNDESHVVFSDIFPDTKLKAGTKAYHKWAIEGEHFSYIGAGVGGSVTGKGGSILIVDDPIKNAETAVNEEALDKIWQWYTGTFLSRVSAKDGQPIEIIVMTRWSKKDLCGHLLESKDKNNWFVLSLKAYDKELDKMLCPSILDKDRYETLKSLMMAEIFDANYNQEPIDLKGRLYQSFKTYVDLPKDATGKVLLETIRNYTDTADTGDDYLCSICFGVYKGEAYVLDVLYTKKPMEYTEPETADMLVRNDVKKSDIESNNGGRGFARNVNRLTFERHKKRIPVNWFHQSENKISRIFTNSAYVQNSIYFPINWKDKWPEYHSAMTTYQKEGKNKHDDAPDATTGIAETIQGKLPSKAEISIY